MQRVLSGEDDVQERRGRSCIRSAWWSTLMTVATSLQATCKFSHGYDLSPEQKKQFREELASTPCRSLMRSETFFVSLNSAQEIDGRISIGHRECLRVWSKALLLQPRVPGTTALRKASSEKLQVPSQCVLEAVSDTNQL